MVKQKRKPAKAKTSKTPKSSRWITRKEDFKFFSTKHTIAGSLTLAFLVIVLFITSTILLANLAVLNLQEQHLSTYQNASESEQFVEEDSDTEVE